MEYFKSTNHFDREVEECNEVEAEYAQYSDYAKLKIDHSRIYAIEIQLNQTAHNLSRLFNIVENIIGMLEDIITKEKG